MNNNNFFNNQNAKRLGETIPTIFDIISRPLSDFGILNTNGEDSGDNFKIDVKDAQDHYEIKADLPGVKKEDIKLDFDDGILKISAEHHQQKDEEQQGYIIHERTYGSYERSLRFEDVDANGISAAFNEGVLEISVPKLKNEVKKTTITIN